MKIESLHYNYVVIGMGDYYKYAYSDLYGLENIKYYYYYYQGMKSRLFKYLTLFNFSNKINKRVTLPLQRLLNSSLFNPRFDNDLPTCYLFFGRHESLYHSSFLKHLKKRNPQNKTVLYFQDLMRTHRIENPDNLKNMFDMVISYDRNESSKYGFLQFDSPYSKIKLPKTDSNEIDVFFLGKTKKRIGKIIDIYNKCKQRGLKVLFIVVDTLRDTTINPDDFTHYDPADFIYGNDIIDYGEYLQHMIKSKCILEIMQDDAVGYTPRTWESIFYNKHLLTDNSDIVNYEFYNKDYMHSLDEVENIESWINTEVKFPENIIPKKSPIELIRFIDSSLTEKNSVSPKQ